MVGADATLRQRYVGKIRPKNINYFMCYVNLQFPADFQSFTTINAAMLLLCFSCSVSSTLVLVFGLSLHSLAELIIYRADFF